VGLSERASQFHPRRHNSNFLPVVSENTWDKPRPIPMSTGVKREVDEGSVNAQLEGKKPKTEELAVVKNEGQSTSVSRVKVQLQLDDDLYDDDDEDGAKHKYVDMENEEECAELKFANYGWKDNYSCCRMGRARVQLDGSVIGWIRFNLINRALIVDRVCPDMVEVCDAESAELYDLALKFFDDDGFLKGPLAKKVSEEANFDYFLYIREIELKAPYSRTATEENVAVAADAIDKFVRSPAFNNGEMTVTLAM
jgi:hypothetical protein